MDAAGSGAATSVLRRARMGGARRFGGILAIFLLAAGSVAAWTPAALFGPCRGDCGVAVYGGPYVNDALTDLVTDPRSPSTWDYRRDFLVAAALSRDAARFGHLHLEPELGLGQRIGQQHETEVWAALFFRYRGFPWDHRLTTTVAVSTGLNYATGISELEQERARDGRGSRLMHFFSPEITFALPSRPEVELLFRFHHRSGVFGLVSDAWGGAQYLTVGLRYRF
jgi:hypothetical protein